MPLSRFLGSYFKGDMGQYFTPREVVEFIVEDGLHHTMTSIVLDPACGSGGFLLHAMDRILKGGIPIFHREGTPEHYDPLARFRRKAAFRN